jgi:AraC-like DNA-binding protein
VVYREIRPHPQLQPWVHCYWDLEGADPESQIIYPDGRAEIVFHYGEAFTFEGVKQARALFAGQLSTAITISPGRTTGAFGVRFTPGGACAILRFAQSQMLDKITSLGDVCRSLEKAAAERIYNAESTFQRIRIIEERLLSLAPDGPNAMEILAAAISEGTMTSREAQHASSLGERQWERLFQERTGLRPKLLERIGRFRRALQLSRNRVAWAEIAQQCNYSDQSHLVREFRQFTGTPPTRVDRDLFG